MFISSESTAVNTVIMEKIPIVIPITERVDLNLLLIRE